MAKAKEIAQAEGIPLATALLRVYCTITMRVKVGKLVWSPLLNAGRFGARGGYVTPEVAAELEAKAGRPQGPTSRVEDLLNAEQDGETVDWKREKVAA